ncbi:hypothetical protein Tco_0238578 [Tanacetum coccineum]
MNQSCVIFARTMLVMVTIVHQLLSKLVQDLQSINEELAEYINTPSWNLPTSSYDDDDDEYYFATQEYLMTCSTAITPDSPKTDSLIMVDKHLDTIPETKSDDFIKFSTFSNPLFDDSTSSDDESSHVEFNPTHNEDLDSMPKDVCFDAESYILELLVNRDTLMASPLKIDFLLDEFAGELTHLQLIPPGIDNINLDPEGDILFLESLLYDNSYPRPSEAFQANSNTIIESLPISVDVLREEIDILHGPDDSIPPGIESDDFDSEDDNNSTSLPEFESFHVDYPDSGDSTIDVVEDIHVDVPNILPTHPTQQLDFDFIPSSNDLESDHDVSSPSGDRNKIYDPGICIESDDFDSEDDDNSTFLSEFESFHVDYPDSGDSTIAFHMDFDFIPSINDLGSDLNDSSPSRDRNKIYDPGICIEVKSTRFLATLSPVIDTLIPFSFENDDKVFNHGVLASKKKSPPSSSHWGLKASKLFHHKSPMLIHGYNTSNLGVRHPHFYPL